MGADEVCVAQVSSVFHVQNVDAFVLPEVPDVRAGVGLLVDGSRFNLPLPLLTASVSW